MSLTALHILINNCSLGWEEQRRIEDAYLEADELEREYIRHYLNMNQIDKVREGTASKKEINERIKLICGL